jgi:hypothetical protein
VRFVEDVGGLQLDSINVLDRAHYLTVWSRFGPYDRRRLDRLVYTRRELFEYWAHAACLVATSTAPWWRRAMLDYRLHHTGWSGWLQKNSRMLRTVRAAIQANGPMAGGELDAGRSAGGRGGWWDWKPVHHALHYLWMTGVLTVHSRQHFQKRFDLWERALAGTLEVEPVSPAEFLRWHVERSLAAMGAATETDLARYLTFPRVAPALRRATLRALVERGDVVEVTVEGAPGRWLALARDLPALRRAAGAASRGTTLLSPFDSLLWHRERVARLFDFDYRIEVYTPGPRRVHGYYTLPILHDGRLIGRVDAKRERAARRLDVRHVHFEPWFARGATPPGGGERVDGDAALAGLADALDALATFVDARETRLERVTPGRLRAPLGRHLKSRGASAKA